MIAYQWRVLAHVSITYFAVLLVWLFGTHYVGSMPEFIGWLPYFATVAAGAYIGLKTSSRMYLVAFIFGFVASVLIGCINFISEFMGFGSDFYGLSGALFVIALSLPFALICSVFGSALGSYANPSDRNP